MAIPVLVGLWGAISFVFVVAGCVRIFSPWLPSWFDDVFLYGKTKGKQQSAWRIINLIEVPKKAFLYFYIWGVLVTTTSFILASRSYVYGIPPPETIRNFLNWLYQPKVVSTTATSALIASGMAMFQLNRRTLECLLVSVYSKGTMNIMHFFLGVIFYTGIPFVILSEAPPIDGTFDNLKNDLFKVRHLIGINLFMVASFYHNQTNRIFASLRKNKEGKVSSYQHRIPHGGLFSYVSCPHYFTEILTYTAMLVTVGYSHVTFWSLLIFVIVNQVLLAWFAHQWYKETFKTYPKNRRAIIPYIL